jgi:hypothetical protein
MAINVSISDKGSDYIARGLMGAGEGIGAGLTARGEKKLSSFKYLADSSDPASAAVGREGLRQSAGVDQAFENQVLSNNILALAEAGELSDEEAQKALAGNTAKMRETVSRAATKQVINNARLQQAAIEAEQLKGFQDQKKVELDYALEAEKRADARDEVQYNREQAKLTEQSRIRAQDQAKEQIRAHRAKLTADERAFEEDRADFRRRADDLINAGALSPELADAAELMPADQRGKFVTEAIQDRLLKIARAKPDNYEVVREGGAPDGKILYIRDKATETIIPGGVWDNPAATKTQSGSSLSWRNPGGEAGAPVPTPSSEFAKRIFGKK